MRYDEVSGVKEYIIKMVHIQSRLKTLNLIIPNACTVHQELNIILVECGFLVTTYNSQ